jgi:hypothetical protein
MAETVPPACLMVSTCEVMSRFLVWVYLEACVVKQANGEPVPISSRERMLTLAIEIGLLRLDWRRF